MCSVYSAVGVGIGRGGIENWAKETGSICRIVGGSSSRSSNNNSSNSRSSNSSRLSIGQSKSIKGSRTARECVRVSECMRRRGRGGVCCLNQLTAKVSECD